MSLGLGYGVKSRHVCGLPGFGTSGEHWISGVAGLIRPHSVAPFPLLGNMTGASTRRRPSQQAHTPERRPRCSSAAPCWRRVAQHVYPSHPSHRWTHTDRLMENGVPPSVAVARLGQTETEVCLLQSPQRQVCTPAGCLPHALVMGGLSQLTGAVRDRRERSAWRGSLGVASPPSFQAVLLVQTWTWSGDGDCLSLDLVMRDGEIVGRNVLTQSVLASATFPCQCLKCRCP